ncbi:EcsC family protein [Bacillus taeanensis]|uniref:EcsC family protein n=1 Tax=Bacillus taeanensis TaxID=273032 RepID=A0A366XZV3_9BACI|nr:EcsC family protein [Bacillus taeanensis]RBW71467.1 EcsC family protein [Bacillus taeanensis]
MTWTKQHEKVWQELLKWEKDFFHYHPNDFQLTAQKYIENQLGNMRLDLQEKVFNIMDNLLFHTHALIQNSHFQLDARHRLLTEAQVFNEEIEEISDLKSLPISQLTYIADQQIARQRLFSFAQGGLSGTGSLLLLGMDLPAMFALNLRAIQLIAMTYGYEVNRPYEMMLALKLFYMASLPKNMQKAVWEELEQEVKDEVDPYFYQGREELTDITWFHSTLKQAAKAFMITILRKKMIQGIPLIGIVFGAGMNYQFSRTITEIAHKFYQKRYLLEKKTQ